MVLNDTTSLEYLVEGAAGSAAGIIDRLRRTKGVPWDERWKHVFGIKEMGIDFAWGVGGKFVSNKLRKKGKGGEQKQGLDDFDGLNTDKGKGKSRSGNGAGGIVQYAYDAVSGGGDSGVNGKGNEIKAGKNFKEHFIRHKSILERLTGKKYPKYKTHGQEFLNDIKKVIDDGTVEYIGKGTLKKGQPAVNIYRGNGVTIVTKADGEFVTIIESGKGMDLGIQMID